MDAHQSWMATNKTPDGNGVRKIILATDVIESSITIPDVKYGKNYKLNNRLFQLNNKYFFVILPFVVIDFCLTKERVTDPQTKISSLPLTWASQENCAQRAGRAGRVMNGYCFRLVPQEFYGWSMTAKALPEMLTSTLESVILKAKHLNFGTPEEILSFAMDPPKLDNINQSIVRLKEIGALSRTMNGEFVENDGDLTTVGQLMARLSVDPCLAKLMLLGFSYGVLQDCIVIGTCENYLYKS